MSEHKRQAKLGITDWLDRVIVVIGAMDTGQYVFSSSNIMSVLSSSR